MGLAIGDYLTPTLRLGVTGLSRSGKTVFITALVRCLIEGDADPAFGRLRGVNGFHAYLEPQPDDDVPRFAYEEHLEALSEDPPRWPRSTTRISQLRLTIEWQREGDVFDLFGLPGRLHVDIIDYPGEWLIDLGLLDADFGAWSREALGLARDPRLSDHAKDFLNFLEGDGVGLDGPADEAVAIEGAKYFTAYLRAARSALPSLATLGPGRFVLPGDLEGSPQLTFFPLEAAGEDVAGSSQSRLGGLLARRYESYKANVVKPFFEKHFSRLDRQIVLVDVLGALNGGADALRDLDHGLEGVLKAFRPGARSWLSFMMSRRIDRIVFAGTKADHVHVSNHDRLAAVLDKAVGRAAQRADDNGASTVSLALAALRATQDVETVRDGVTYPCIRGVPEAGQKAGGRTFDGRGSAVVFPGDLPRDALDAFEPEKAGAEAFSFVRFRPPACEQPDRLEDKTSPGRPCRWPHIALDQAFAFLIGDKLP